MGRAIVARSESLGDAVRVLVTGGAGYIGSHTAKALHQSGYEVVVLDNLSTGHGSSVRWGPLVVGDVRDGESVANVLSQHQPDAVVHFAASAYVADSMVEPSRYFDNNVTGSLNLIAGIVADGPRPFVFSSSCATYGLPAELPISEQAPQHPINPYGESKLMVERALGWHSDLSALPVMILRYFNAAGADIEGEIGEIHDPEPHLVPRVIRAALAGEPIVVNGDDYVTPDGTAVRDYVHVTDLARAHVRAVEALVQGSASHSLNLGTGAGHSVLDVIAAIEVATEKHIEVTLGARRPGDPPELVANPGLASGVLGWKPEHSGLHTIIESAVRWAKIRQAES